MKPTSGSEKLYAAWNARALTKESLAEIGQALDASAGVVKAVELSGGAEPTGVAVTLEYNGDDILQCGPDLTNWLVLQQKLGAGVRVPPHFNPIGIPTIEELRVVLHYGHPSGPALGQTGHLGEGIAE